ncbi:MAG: hypothetical protein PF694_11015 [Bacteroidetes bacterium]|jgi:hypothetical protein|nr:hypothetical protein [Bacteroidota bacterium]
MLALLIGFFFFRRGVINIFMLPSPLWFTIILLHMAYIPMAWLGAKIAGN